jgi:hypothetical protein
MSVAAGRAGARGLNLLRACGAKLCGV